MTDDTFDERYVRFREHAELAKEVTELKSSQAQNSASLQRIEALLIARPSSQMTAAPQETALAAVLHRALDAADKRQPQGSTPVTHVLSLIGALTVGGVAAFLLLGLSL